MKKMKVVRSRKRFSEGGEMPNIPREPLRDSSGDIVRDSSGEAVMSGSTKKRTESGPKGYLDDDIKGPSKEDNGPVQRPPGATPIKNVDIDESDRRREERENAKRTQDVDESDRRREQIANLKPSSKPEKKPEKKPEAKPPGRTASGKTAEQEEEGRKKFAEDQGRRNLQRLQKEDKPLEPVTPEKNLIGGVPLRGAKAMASGLKEMGSYLKDRFGKEAPKVAGQLGHSGKRADNLTKDMGPVELAAGKRSMLQNQSGSSEPIRMGAANRYRAEQAKRNAADKRKKETESDVSRFEGEGGRAMRKGGKVHKYAKGGSVGSASRRGDGIAIRGKTRGKMF